MDMLLCQELLERMYIWLGQLTGNRETSKFN
jgi:hypothetical protein